VGGVRLFCQNQKVFFRLSLSAQRESSHDAVGLDEIIFVGGTYAFSDNVSTSLYYSDLKDAFEKY